MPLWETLSKLLIFDERETHPLKQYVQIEIAILYLIILKQLRKVFLYAVGIVFTLFIICIGLSYLVISMAATAEPYVSASVGVGVILVIIPTLIAGILLLQSSWLRVFGADQMLKAIEENKGKNKSL